MESCNCPLSFNQSIFDIMFFLLRFIVEFDTSYLFPKSKQIGGAYNQPGHYGSNNSNNRTQYTRNDSRNTDDSQSDSDKQSNVSIIIDEISNGISAGKDWLVAVLMVVVNFILYASIYPSIPFFGVLAFAYAFLNWFIMKFRKL